MLVVTHGVALRLYLLVLLGGWGVASAAAARRLLGMSTNFRTILKSGTPGFNAGEIITLAKKWGVAFY